MKFNIIWASVTPVYVGMIYGLLRMLPQVVAQPHNAVGWHQMVLGTGFGLLAGGAMALPLAASNLAASSLASWMTRGQAFWTQFGVFTLLAFVFYHQLLKLLDSELRTMGGLKLDLWQVGFVTAGLALALIFMALGLKPRTAWS